MAVTWELKCYTILVFLYLVNNTRSMLSLPGKNHKIQSLSKLTVQEHPVSYWPKGIVLYYFDNLTYDNYIAQRVRMAMNVLESASCVQFKPTIVKPTKRVPWIHFTNPDAERNCVHQPKIKENREIVLVLGLDCLKEHEILHSLLHAIGFNDEVSHPRRDQYIRVMWNNIQPEYRHLYRIQSYNDKNSQLLVEYDPLSIMHFHDRAFSLNGQATVLPMVPGLLISPSDDLSQLDKMRLRLLFDHECNKRKVGDVFERCKALLTKDEKYSGSSEEKKSKKKDQKDGANKTDDSEEDVDEQHAKSDNSDDTSNDKKKISSTEGADKVDEEDTGEEFVEDQKKNEDLDSSASVIDKKSQVTDIDEPHEFINQTHMENEQQSDAASNKVLNAKKFSNAIYGFGLG